jgi:hypothetical protein
MYASLIGFLPAAANGGSKLRPLIQLLYSKISKIQLLRAVIAQFTGDHTRAYNLSLANQALFATSAAVN